MVGLAGGGGFEPPLMDPESTVLPLDDPPAEKAENELGSKTSLAVFQSSLFQPSRGYYAAKHYFFLRQVLSSVKKNPRTASLLGDDESGITHNLPKVARDVP
jgi:hypothetical protein